MVNKANGAAGDSAVISKAEQAKPATPDATTPPQAAQITPEMRAKIADLRTRIQTSVGQVVLAMVNLPRYRNQTLADLSHLVIEPLLRDRLAIAMSRGKEEESATDAVLAGIAIWASVSDEVDVKIREQVKAGVFPVRLGGEDWTSGETLWLLDVIAPTRKLATSVLANFQQVAGDKSVSVHPIVARSVEPELLEKMKIKEEKLQR